jgi:hypothetical protein
MVKRDERKAELKFLIAIYSDEVFTGQTLRQAKPSCCGKVIDLYKTDVSFREIALGKKVFHLIEPRCPSCGKRVKATYTLLS